MSKIRLVEDNLNTVVATVLDEKTSKHQTETSLTNKEIQNLCTKVMRKIPKENEKDIVGDHESSIVTPDYIQQSMN